MKHSEQALQDGARPQIRAGLLCLAVAAFVTVATLGSAQAADEALSVIDVEMSRIDIDKKNYDYDAGAKRVEMAGVALIPEYDRAFLSVDPRHVWLISSVLIDNEMFPRQEAEFGNAVLRYAMDKIRALPDSIRAGIVLSYFDGSGESAKKDSALYSDKELLYAIAAYLWDERVDAKLTAAGLEERGIPAIKIRVCDLAARIVDRFVPNEGIVGVDIAKPYAQAIVARAKSWVDATCKDRVAGLRGRIPVGKGP